MEYLVTMTTHVPEGGRAPGSAPQECSIGASTSS